MTERYVFLPWLRSGIAAHLGSAPGGLRRASVTTAISGNAERLGDGSDALEIPPRDVQLYGPSDVLGFDPTVISAIEPRAGVGDFEPNYLCAVTFAAPDFPWRFSPSVPDQSRRLQPWVVLIAVLEDEINGEVAAGDPRLPPCVQVAATALPNLSECWRWAHVQVTCDGVLTTDALRDLLANEPHRVVSRLLCARRLAAGQRYVALIVPTFATGVCAGRRIEPVAGTTSLTPAWPDNPTKNVWLPYYYRWEFGTGQRGDFESLVRLHEPRPLKRLGRRDFDCTKPGFGVLRGPDKLGLEGALCSIDCEWDKWGHDAHTPALPTTMQEGLASLLNQPLADLAKAPIVGPPIYGRWHRARSKVFLCQNDADPQSSKPLSTDWVDQLNLDPRHRAAAGLGAEVVERNQEALMASAWKQLGAVDRANEILRRAQLGREGSGTLYGRLGQLGLTGKISVLGPIAGRVKLSGATTTLGATLGQVRACRAALDSGFRRIARLRGPVRRRQDLGKLPTTGVLLSRLHAADPTKQIVAAGSSPAPNGAPSLFSVSEELRSAELGNVTNVAAFSEAKLNANMIRAGVTALSGPELGKIGNKWGTAQELGGLADAITGALARFLAGEPETPLVTPIGNADLGFAQPLMTALDPEKTIPARIALLLPKRPSRPNADPLALVMAAPEFPQPMYEPLRDISHELLLPGIETVPQNTLVLLRTNRRFVEAYHAGLNDAFARELRWREYPTDQRGTYFRQFWDTSLYATTDELRERYKDIERMYLWSGKLGQNRPRARPAGEQDQTVLLVRGDLLRKYPNTVVYAVPADAQGLPQFPDETHEPVWPVFGASPPPDLTFFGFNLLPDQMRSGGPNSKGYFVVLEERVGETRFGADEELGKDGDCAPTWNDLSWDYIKVSDGAYINSTTPCAVSNGGVTWSSSASIAYILLQWPMRVAVHAKRMLP